jgi:hypothetical protein
MFNYYKIQPSVEKEILTEEGAVIKFILKMAPTHNQNQTFLNPYFCVEVNGSTVDSGSIVINVNNNGQVQNLLNKYPFSVQRQMVNNVEKVSFVDEGVIIEQLSNWSEIEQMLQHIQAETEEVATSSSSLKCR